MRGPVTGLVERYASRLRCPKLLLITAALFGVDFVLLGSMRKRRTKPEQTD